MSVLDEGLSTLCCHAQRKCCDTQRDSCRQLLILYACLGKCIAHECRLVAVPPDSAPIRRLNVMLDVADLLNKSKDMLARLSDCVDYSSKLENDQ